jgi:heat shock protein HtpX
MQPTFRDLIARNKRNSAILIVIFVLFTTAVFLILGIATLAYIHPESVEGIRVGEAIFAGVLAAGLSLLLATLGYYGGSGMVLAVSGGKEIQHADDPELFNVVEEMSIAAGVPMPRVFLIDDSAPNAFATGRDPKHAAVAMTTGLRSKLNRAELQGVVAHEMGHIRNYDIRLMLLLAVLVGAVVMLADVFLRMTWYSSGSRRRRSSSSDGKGGGAVVAIIMLLAIILAIVAPLLAQIIQLAVSRQREYLADASAVEFTRYPKGLADALRKIDADPDVLETANRGTAHLYIANPIKKFEARASSVFASHPPIEERIRRLEALGT